MKAYARLGYILKFGVKNSSFWLVNVRIACVKKELCEKGEAENY